MSWTPYGWESRPEEKGIKTEIQAPFVINTSSGNLDLKKKGLRPRTWYGPSAFKVGIST